MTSSRKRLLQIIQDEADLTSVQDFRIYIVPIHNNSHLKVLAAILTSTETNGLEEGIASTGSTIKYPKEGNGFLF